MFKTRTDVWDTSIAFIKKSPTTSISVDNIIGSALCKSKPQTLHIWKRHNSKPKYLHNIGKYTFLQSSVLFNQKCDVTRAKECFTNNEIEYLSGMQCRSNGNGKFAFSCNNPKSFLRFLVFCNACEYIFDHRFSTSSGTYRLSNQAIVRKTCPTNNTSGWTEQARKFILSSKR